MPSANQQKDYKCKCRFNKPCNGTVTINVNTISNDQYTDQKIVIYDVNEHTNCSKSATRDFLSKNPEYLLILKFSENEQILTNSREHNTEETFLDMCKIFE